MKETSFKAGVIGGVFTFLALFATTSKASINESAATNGDYKINRVQYEFINELTIYKVSGPGIPGIKYVLIDQKLDAVYGCVQGGHAVAQWLLEHPNQEWNNSYLIYLYADLDKWKVRLDLVNKDYSSFYEPDLDNQLTAIALQDDGRMFKKLKLVRE